MALGIYLALLHLRGDRPKRAIGIIHGLIGAAGIGVLLLVLQGPPRGEATGTQSFGTMSAVLFGVALFGGLSIWFVQRRAPRSAGVVIATHASLAVAAFVLFLAWASL